MPAALYVAVAQVLTYVYQLAPRASGAPRRRRRLVEVPALPGQTD